MKTLSQILAWLMLSFSVYAEETMKFSDFPKTNAASGSWLVLLADPGVTNWSMYVSNSPWLTLQQFNAALNPAIAGKLNNLAGSGTNMVFRYSGGSLPIYIDGGMAGKGIGGDGRVQINPAGAYATKATAFDWTTGMWHTNDVHIYGALVVTGDVSAATFNGATIISGSSVTNYVTNYVYVATNTLGTNLVASIATKLARLGGHATNSSFYASGGGIPIYVLAITNGPSIGGAGRFQINPNATDLGRATAFDWDTGIWHTNDVHIYGDLYIEGATIATGDITADTFNGETLMTSGEVNTIATNAVFVATNNVLTNVNAQLAGKIGTIGSYGTNLTLKYSGASNPLFIMGGTNGFGIAGDGKLVLFPNTTDASRGTVLDYSTGMWHTNDAHVYGSLTVTGNVAGATFNGAALLTSAVMTDAIRAATNLLGPAIDGKIGISGGAVTNFTVASNLYIGGVIQATGAIYSASLVAANVIIATNGISDSFGITHIEANGTVRSPLVYAGSVTITNNMSLRTNAFPASATSAGSCTFWNSNGVLYLLTSQISGTAWTGTNKIAP